MFDLNYEGWIYGCKVGSKEKVMLGKVSSMCIVWWCERGCCVWGVESFLVMVKVDGSERVTEVVNIW